MMTQTLTSPPKPQTTYSLLTEPWIPVVYNDSLKYKNISLQDLFLEWENLKTVQGINPPRTIALWRWLIAFTQWSIQGTKTIDEWKQLWTDENLGSRIIKRLETVKERLDLLHPDFPFGQCKDLREETKGKEPSPVSKILFQDKDSGLLWSKYSDQNPAFLSYAEAVQELLRLLCCDLGGTKSDSQDRSAQTGICVMGRIVMPIGKNVKETLLLNLHQYSPQDDIPSIFPDQDKDLPLWERLNIKKQSRTITGLLDYLTFPNRRVMLIHNGKSVTGVYLYKGEEFNQKDSYFWELWQAYIQVKDESMPLKLKLDINKASWRDAEALLHPTTQDNHKPKIFDWLVKCRHTGCVPDPIPVQVLGFAHGSDLGKPLHWLHDTMTIPQVYLDSKEAYYKLVEGLKYAEKIGRLFSSKTYETVANGLKLSKKDKQKFINQLSTTAAIYWSALDSEFQQFMFELAEDKVVDEEDEDDITFGEIKIPEWKNKLKTIATECYEQSIAGISSYEARARGLNAWYKELNKILRNKP
ncbi:CRISPR-associated protein, Cse1 family [Gloeothece citriformis PCC 7424]|uniref:CRISPR-associated protein, Cse1 family n=1 Tax=Gloeothece citriformis (strain PCC 7424) TaxID=65393 RepID=B7KJ23_GLOC7|nr:type I-E CRISPR-associated protein Cse1/CasA [Gloeothece citriformis]ACK70859.1 CRISPR-associated protein, Cse1 family [Gloeothece citriformis PCC 7424]